MDRRVWLQGLAASALPVIAEEFEMPVLRIALDRDRPENSRGNFQDAESFQVGFGRDGFLPVGSSFVGGFSLLGDFKVNAILTKTSFEMVEELVAESGKSREWLAENLFANMTSIDFNGDGLGGEYGDAFLGLEPVDASAKQPFHFGEYKGVFRWYSYAIHGTQDESRIGKCITGGCINVGREDLSSLVAEIKIGDLVRVSAAG